MPETRVDLMNWETGGFGGFNIGKFREMIKNATAEKWVMTDLWSGDKKVWESNTGLTNFLFLNGRLKSLNLRNCLVFSRKTKKK